MGLKNAYLHSGELGEPGGESLVQSGGGLRVKGKAMENKNMTTKSDHFCWSQKREPTTERTISLYTDILSQQ